MARAVAQRSRRNGKQTPPTHIAHWQGREVAGLSVRYPDWGVAIARRSDIALVIHLTRVGVAADYLRTVKAIGQGVDVFVMVPEGAAGEFRIFDGVAFEVLEGDPVANGLYQLSSLLNSGRLSGYSTVLRHIDDSDSAIDRLSRFIGEAGLQGIDRAIHDDVSLGGFRVPGQSGSPVEPEENLWDRVIQLLLRVSTRIGKPAADTRSLSTIALRGALLEGLGTLQIDHQDFYFTYTHYLDEGLATESLGGTEPDPLASEAVRLALLSLFDLSGMRLDELADPVARRVKHRPTARRAHAWATYHPDLTVPSPVRDASWGQLAASSRMYPGQRLPVVPAELGFSNPIATTDRARQVALAAESGIDGFLVLGGWDREGLQPQQFFESLGSDEKFPWALVVQHPVLRRTDPAGTQARVSAWIDPGVEFYSGVAAQIAELTAHSGYLRIDGRPVVVVENSEALSDTKKFVAEIRLAVAGVVEVDPWIMAGDSYTLFRSVNGAEVPAGFDAIIQLGVASFSSRVFTRLNHRINGFSGPAINLARTFDDDLPVVDAQGSRLLTPVAIVGFDSTPLLRSQGTVGYNWNSMTFRRMLERTVRAVASREDNERIVVISSWNGWSELSQLEPSRGTGAVLLSLVRDALFY